MSKLNECLEEFCEQRNCKNCCIREILPQCGKGVHILYADRKTKDLAKKWIEACMEEKGV